MRISLNMVTDGDQITVLKVSFNVADYLNRIFAQINCVRKFITHNHI